MLTNLSSHTLTNQQRSLLSKGLTFVPDKASVDIPRILADLSEWERRMRLREYFYDVNNNFKEPEKFTEKKESTFTPNKGRDAWLDMYIEVVKNEIIAGLKKTKSLNLSKEENSALHELLHNNEIVIRPADKGSGIVIMDKEDYIKGLKEEMQKSSSYEETEKDHVDKSMKSVKKLVNKMCKDEIITRDMQQYLIPRYPQAGQLKGNPKIHKRDMPLRTIVNGINTPTERLAEVAEHELNEFVVNSPSYIKDTTDFLKKLVEIQQPLQDKAILFCFDVAKLYPSVPRREGLQACEEGLRSRTSPILPSSHVLRMIETVLDNNVFSFHDTYYVQTDGVAIGSKLGKNFACAYMRTWDRKLAEYEKQPVFYKRFIDDGFGIWTHGEESLKAFADYANNIHSNISIELRYSPSRIEFLDTNVRLENGRLITDLYSKPTDKHLYLQNKSNHPPHTKKAVPYGLGIRIKRICQDDIDYQRRRKELKQQLRRRGYSGKHIESQLQKVDAIPREQLLLYRRKKNKSDRTPLVLTYAKQLPNVGAILRKHMSLLHKSERMQEVFKEEPMAAYRRDRNLEDILVHGKLRKDMHKHRRPCQSHCRTCEVKLDSDVNCTEKDVVYGLFCTACDKTVYVGETGRELKERTEEHLRDIRLNRDRAVSFHFNSNGHSIKNLKVTILEKVRGQSKSLRLIKESDWINKLNTKFPVGLNSREVRQM